MSNHKNDKSNNIKHLAILEPQWHESQIELIKSKPIRTQSTHKNRLVRNNYDIQVNIHIHKINTLDTSNYFNKISMDYN